MKYFIALVALIAMTAAVPVNFTSSMDMGRAGGFASFGGGTYGGQGGTVLNVFDAWALRDAVNGNARRIINIGARIDLTVLFTGSPGVRLQVGSYKTIQGMRNVNRVAEIFGGGLYLFQRTQVIIYNLKITNALNYAPGERPNGNGGIVSMVPGAYSTFDSINIDGSDHVWVDHNTLSDDPWVALNTPDNQRRHHGLIGIKLGANYITISNNIFRNHNLCMVLGHDDSNGWQDIGKLKVTYYGNWFQGTIQRHPLVRFGEVHIYNNLYTNNRDYGIGIGVGARIYAERNVFISVRRAWALMARNQNPQGFLAVSENSLQSSTVDSGISSNIGWHPNNYYRYTSLPTNQVEQSVRTYSGII